MECEGCNKTFSTKYTLAIHQKSSKSCGNGEKFKCEMCDKLFTSKLRLRTHGAICKATPNRQEVINSKLAEYEIKIESLERALKDKTEQLNARTEQLNTLLKKQESIKPLKLDPVIIREKLSRIDIKDIKNGQEGIAEFIVKNILTSDDGTLLYRCIDISRSKFVYYDVEGNQRFDYKTQVLVNCLSLSKFFVDIYNISKKFYDESNMEDFVYWHKLLKSLSDIRNFERNKKFRRHIMMFTS